MSSQYKDWALAFAAVFSIVNSELCQLEHHLPKRIALITSKHFHKDLKKCRFGGETAVVSQAATTIGVVRRRVYVSLRRTTQICVFF